MNFSAVINQCVNAKQSQTNTGTWQIGLEKRAFIQKANKPIFACTIVNVSFSCICRPTVSLLLVVMLILQSQGYI